MLKIFSINPIFLVDKLFKHSLCSKSSSNLRLLNKNYERDEFTNVTDRIITKLGSNLHCNRNHPLGILTERIKQYFYENYRKQYRSATPVYTIFDNLCPIVSTKQNFDDLLIPEDHISRRLSDTYYINKSTMLRGHTSAHEAELIRSGLDAFIIIGDVYRRDEIDSTHYPIFHQVEGVRLYTKEELRDMYKLEGNDRSNIELINTESLRTKPELRSNHKQEKHSELLNKFLEIELKTPLENLVKVLFGKDINYKWVDAYFPWTHPSFELEIETKPGCWMEMLGCGVIEQDMLEKCGVGDRFGIAFGLGLERWAMQLYDIPDIRVFWSNDPGFLTQFKGITDVRKSIKYKPVSSYPVCINDLSFWLSSNCKYHHNDLYELAGSIVGDYLERVELIDEYQDEKTKRQSVTYRLYYRHLMKNLTKTEVNQFHSQIEQMVKENFNGDIR